MYKEVLYKMSTAGRYNRVGSKKGPLIISGAEKKIAEDKTFMYVPMFKVAGPEKEVAEWLTQNHPDDKDVAIKTAYCKRTLKTKSIRMAFDKEIDDANEIRNQVNQSRADMRSVNLMILSELIKIYDSSRKNLYEKEQFTFKDKLEMIKNENKCFDVTNLSKKGTDGKKVMLTDMSIKKRLSQNSNELFYNVVYNPNSDRRFEGVSNLMTLVGGFTTKQIASVLEQIKVSSNIVNITTQRSPTRSPVSPNRPRVIDSPPRHDIAESEDDTDDE